METARGRIPPKFKDRLPSRFKADQVLNVILFIGDELVLSRQAHKGVDKLGDAAGLPTLALAYKFTKDAVELLDNRGIEPIALFSIFWTDQSWLEHRRDFK